MTAAGLFTAAVPAAMAANAAIQVGVCRWRPGAGWLKSFFAGFAAGLAVLAVLGVAALKAGGAAPADAFFLALTAVVSFGALSFFYFNIVNGGKSALRVRLLRELHDVPAGLTLEEILRRYPPEEMIGARMKRLLGHGQLVVRDGRYFVGRPAMAWITRAVFLVKFLVLGRRSEFAAMTAGGVGMEGAAAGEQSFFQAFAAKFHFWQFMRFATAGAVATLTDWGAFYLLAIRGGLHYQAALVASLAMSTLVHYTINKFFTFRSTTRQIARQMLIHACLSVVYILMNMGLMYLLVSALGWPRMASKMLATGLMVSVSFGMHKFITFNERLFRRGR